MKMIQYCIFIVVSFVKRLICIFNMIFVNNNMEITQIQPIHNYQSQSELDKIYIEKNCRNFLKLISTVVNNKNDHPFNSNIDPIFYNKNDYIQLLENDTNALESNWKTKIMIENTSRGNLIMFFDVYKFGFSYYSDQNIPGVILNASAMKYVKMFHCFDFFIDNQLFNGMSSPLFMLQNNPPERMKSKSKTKLETNKSSLDNNPYARFKKYNNLPVTPMCMSTNVPLPKDNPVIEELHKNKFMYLGKTSNFSLLKSTKVNEPNPFFNTKSRFDNLFYGEKNIQKVALNYKDFKNIKLNLS